MAKASAKDPRSNLFELLADDSSSPVGEPKKKSKASEPKKEEKVVKAVVGATPTPAAQAAARKQKEAEKPKVEPPTVVAAAAPKEENKAEPEQPGEPRKLTKEEWLANVDDNFKLVQSKKAKQEHEEGGNRPPRQGGEGGRRGGRGGRRGGRGGRNNNQDPRAPRLEENRNRDVNQRGQDLSEGNRDSNRGREFDRKSGMVTGRKAPPKKQGAGGRNTWGDDKRAPQAEAPANQDQTTGWEDPAPVRVNNDAAWGDEEVAKTQPAEGTEGAEGATEGAAEGAVQPAKAADSTEKTWDHFVLEKEKKAKELAEKLASLAGETAPLPPRQVEVDSSDSLKAVENLRPTANDSVKAIEKPAQPEKETKEKKDKKSTQQVLDVSFRVKGMGRPPRARRGGFPRDGEPREEGQERTEKPERQERQERNYNNPNRGTGGRRGRPRKPESPDVAFPTLEALKV